MPPTVLIEIIENKIYVFRGQKVMLDRDLAKLYGVQTKRFNEAVRRNIRRFPEDFSFRLTKDEFASLRSQIATSNRGGQRYEPFVFTEQGIAMLSSVLNSEKAIAINIQIIRAFIYLRDMAIENSDLRLRLEYMEKNYDQQFRIIFNALQNPQQDNFIEEEQEPMGFKDSGK